MVSKTPKQAKAKKQTSLYVSEDLKAKLQNLSKKVDGKPQLLISFWIENADVKKLKSEIYAYKLKLCSSD